MAVNIRPSNSLGTDGCYVAFDRNDKNMPGATGTEAQGLTLPCEATTVGKAPCVMTTVLHLAPFSLGRLAICKSTSN